jgi:tetratricopeptide (TPR) repeat protein
MKKFLVAVMFGLMAIAAQAEATFDQIEGLIQQKNYQAAEKGLEVIIQNHPQSAKAFYAMAQAQAGLGNLDKAQKALNIATGLNPTLDFAPASSVASLKQAITPQVAKIEAIEESHFWRNAVLVLFVFAVGGIIYTVYRKNKEADEKYEAELKAIEEKARADREAERKRQHMEMLAQQDAERKAELAAEEALKAHKNYGHERFDPENPDKLKTVKRMKEEVAEKQRLFLEAEARRERLRAEAAEDEARRSRMTYSQSAPTVVHTNSGSNDMLTGILVGNMLSGSHHDTTRVVEREVVREVPAPSRSSTWDDTPAPSKSSTWDDTPSKSSRSSSWDDDSSSKSSSSLSSSSSSDSSSSWSSSSDSGSSSSSASWD